MTIFVIGFVLSSSGWGLMIAYGFQGRPSYSVCGQDMCSCLPTTPAEPSCPLCTLDEESNSSCSSTGEPSPNRKRLPKTDRFDSISTAAQYSSASMFLSLVFGIRGQSDWSHTPIAKIDMIQDRIPHDPLSDLPTPPPRS